jgi:hypothetical protein
LAAFKEERLSKLLKRLIDAEKQICQLGSVSSFGGEIKTSPLTDEIKIDDVLKEAFWREKLNKNIPQGIHAELKRLEVAVRQDLQ